MASLLPRNGELFSQVGTAPPPNKDFCQLQVLNDEIVFRFWKISMRSDCRNVAPGELRNSYEDFLDDDRVHSEIHRVFGRNMVDYIKGLATGHIDYFPRLPKLILLKIVQNLDLEDINRMSQVSKQFKDLCQGDELWHGIYHQHSESTVTDELRSLAEAIGWRKLFFTNKLQLQLQLRRQAKTRTDDTTPTKADENSNTESESKHQEIITSPVPS